jgi:hypothetical protein
MGNHRQKSPQRISIVLVLLLNHVKMIYDFNKSWQHASSMHFKKYYVFGFSC